MIKAIFYTRFHIEKGTSVLHQVPSGAIVPFSSYISSSQAGLPSNSSHSSETTSAETLFDFSTISDLLIPRQEFCDRLVTICVNKYRVIGHPVCIQHSRYDRNEFIFNLAMVLDEDVEFSGHTSVVRKMARMLRNLEEQRQFLSREEDEHYGLDASLEGSGELDRLLMLDEMVEGTGNMDLSGSGLFDAFEREGAKKVYALCEMIMEDLNNYSECMIPIGEIELSLDYIEYPLMKVIRSFEYDQSEAISDKSVTSSSVCVACPSIYCGSYHHCTVF